MAKLPVPGRVKTRLGLPPPLAAQIYTAMARDVVATVEAQRKLAPMNVVLSVAADPDASLEPVRAWLPEGWRVVRQSPGDLGARMLEAWDEAEAEHGLVLGTDAPHIASSRLEEVFSTLEVASERSAVFVPALDGGYVGFGLSTREPALFRGIRWSTPTVMAETERAAEGAGLRLVRTAPERDVDIREDLEALCPLLAPGSRTARLLREVDLGTGSARVPLDGPGRAD